MKSLDRADSTDDAHRTTIHFRVLNGMVDVTNLPACPLFIFNQTEPFLNDRY
jgi:hypothetical protein